MWGSAILFQVLLAGASLCAAETLPFTDSANIRSGSFADTPQAWSTMLSLTNAADTSDNCRIAMMKADVSSLTGSVTTATLSISAKDAVAYTLYVFEVKDSASFQDWTGGDTGTATWNSVTANGLFTPKSDLYSTGDTNLVLLGSRTMPGAGAGDVQIAISNRKLEIQPDKGPADSNVGKLI